MNRHARLAFNGRSNLTRKRYRGLPSKERGTFCGFQTMVITTPRIQMAANNRTFREHSSGLGTVDARTGCCMATGVFDRERACTCVKCGSCEVMTACRMFTRYSRLGFSRLQENRPGIDPDLETLCASSHRRQVVQFRHDTILQSLVASGAACVASMHTSAEASGGFRGSLVRQRCLRTLEQAVKASTRCRILARPPADGFNVEFEHPTGR